MISSRFTSRVPRFSPAALVFLALATCPSPVREPAPRKAPAVIKLPAQGSPQAFKDIEKALDKFDQGGAHDARCTGCLIPDAVTIKYVGKTKDLKPGNGPPKLRIVAIINNTSNGNVEHTPSGTTFMANTKYLMWVDSRNGKTVWGFIELGPKYTPNPDPIGLLEDCGDKPSATDDADFKECGQHGSTTSSSGWVKSAYAATEATAAISLRAWVACDPDCCTGTSKLEF